MILEEIKNINTVLPKKVAKKFEEIGNIQRGSPEIIMVKAQHLMGGGVLSFVIEHVGDLLHRMTHLAIYDNFLRDTVLEKVEKTLRILEHPYGFEKEMEENFKVNSKEFNREYEDFRKDVDSILTKYSKEHEKLPVYNKIQWIAKMAAMLLGDQNFNGARRMLNVLKDIASNEEKYDKMVREFELDKMGNLKQFKYHY